ncbi:ran guanine nucleotide release factor-like [Tubulanus polymorphus]|uniref:ran guanine nucleotide release factor-like n=1 Tax=Tubulanus polymorphus TaxID=672921 RepID=UPI003DA58CD8
MTKTQPLFGGALSVNLPNTIVDASDVRQIPDNQEVFMNNFDQTMIVEILEYVQEPDEQALKTHFYDITQTGDEGTGIEILNAEKVESYSMTQCSGVYYISGKSHVAKFKEDARNEVETHIAMFRLPQFTTDILINFTSSCLINPESSSYKQVDAAGMSQRWTIEDFTRAVSSLTLIDAGLFG